MDQDTEVTLRPYSDYHFNPTSLLAAVGFKGPDQTSTSVEHTSPFAVHAVLSPAWDLSELPKAQDYAAPLPFYPLSQQ